MSTAADFRVHNEGSLVGFQWLTVEGMNWINDEVQSEGWQWMGRTLWVEHRFADMLIGGIENAGLTVEAA